MGSLTLNPDGSYSYALNTADPVVQALRPGKPRNGSSPTPSAMARRNRDGDIDDRSRRGERSTHIAVNDRFDTVDTPASGRNTDQRQSDGQRQRSDAGATLAVTTVSGSRAGTVGGNTSGTFGTLRLNADGTFTYDVDQTNPVVLSLLTGDSRTDTFLTIGDGFRRYQHRHRDLHHSRDQRCTGGAMTTMRLPKIRPVPAAMSSPACA